MREREAVWSKQLVSDLTHSLASCMERDRLGKGKRETGREGESQREGRGGRWGRGRERGGKGDRGNRELTVAGSLANQIGDEGIWVWLCNSGAKAGQDKFTVSASPSSCSLFIFILFSFCFVYCALSLFLPPLEILCNLILSLILC